MKFPPPEERLRARLVATPEGCLEWAGNKTNDGYGQISVKGRMRLTHRFAWELTNGPIPPGICVLHHCDNPPCCEAEGTDHLFLGTHAENMADKSAKGRHSEQPVTHCPKNHEYTFDNTGYTNKGSRYCRICARAYSRAYSAAHYVPHPKVRQSQGAPL
jgi:hypothetical protein